MAETVESTRSLHSTVGHWTSSWQGRDRSHGRKTYAGRGLTPPRVSLNCELLVERYGSETLVPSPLLLMVKVPEVVEA